ASAASPTYRTSGPPVVSYSAARLMILPVRDPGAGQSYERWICSGSSWTAQPSMVPAFSYSSICRICRPLSTVCSIGDVTNAYTFSHADSGNAMPGRTSTLASPTARAPADARGDSVVTARAPFTLFAATTPASSSPTTSTPNASTPASWSVTTDLPTRIA